VAVLCLVCHLAPKFNQLMNSQIFDKIGDWNPQLFRELKGRLKFRNVAIALAISILAQGLLMLWFWSRLPIADPLRDNICRNYYCFIDGGILDGNAIDWTRWWLDQFKVLTWGIPLFLIPSGVYFLVSDLSQEQQKGTLNFIRLSPQSSRSILMGKILGVPAISYVGVATVLPLYVWSAVAGGVSLGFLLSYVLMIGVGCYFVYSLSLLCAFLIGSAKSNSLYQAGVGLVTSVAALLFSYLYLLGNILTSWRQFDYSLNLDKFTANIEWFYLPVSENTLVAHALVLGSLSVGINATWFALNRSFHNPNATVLNKSRSYFLVAFTELLALGFFVRARDHINHQLDLISTGLVFMYAFNLFAFLVLITILTPQRQTLIDWARYRHTSKSSLLKDLLWSEKSPAMLAIAINLGIVSIILLPWLIWNPVDRNFGSNIWLTPVDLIIGLFSTGLVTLIYAAIAQLILLMKTPIRQQLAIGVIGALIIIPPAVLTLLFGDPTKHLLLWMLTGSPWIAIFNPAVVNVAIATSVHGGILLALSLTLKQKLIKVGESEFKLHSARNTPRKLSN
jgi:uncharacterized membrane protein YidH (DUF202 family)